MYLAGCAVSWKKARPWMRERLAFYATITSLPNPCRIVCDRVGILVGASSEVYFLSAGFSSFFIGAIMPIAAFGFQKSGSAFTQASGG